MTMTKSGNELRCSPKRSAWKLQLPGAPFPAKSDSLGKNSGGENFLKKPLDISRGLCYYNHCSDAEHLTRGYSSAGRALEWHSRGQRFDPAYLHQEREKPWNFGFQGFSRDPSISYGPVAQLGERSVRIHSETHPTRFPVPCFSVRFVGLSPENRIF